MLRRFNSLIKGSKLQPDEDFRELNVSLRPARSVDSSLFALQPLPATKPLQQIVRAREAGLIRARSSDCGQTSLASNSQTGSQQTEEERQSFLVDRVPEECSCKEGYEPHHMHALDSPGSPGSPTTAYDFNKSVDFHIVDFNRDLPELRNSSTKTTVDNPAENTTAGQVECIQRPAVPTIGEPGTCQRQLEVPNISRTSSDAVVDLESNLHSNGGYTVVDIPDAPAGSAVDLESLRKGVITTGPGRTISAWSTDSSAECCRICQSLGQEPLIELGCVCRGELAKAHRTCIELWFKNKGTNKCEVCQHVAKNITAPATAPMPHFWVWRLGGAYAVGQTQTVQEGGRRVGFPSGLVVSQPVLLIIIKRHPFIPLLWVLLLAFMTYLFVDAINKSTIGYAAMPIGFLFGVLVVLGLGTAVRLIMECCHERSMRRSIERLEMLPVHTEPVQGGDQPNGNQLNEQSQQHSAGAQVATSIII